MSTPSDRDDRLERSTSRVLGQLPLRRAPAALEARVLAELERRAALPWWRLGFARWPAPARLALIACSAYLAWLSISAVIWVSTSADSARLAYDTVPSFSAVRAAAQFVLFSGRIATSVAHSVPPDWIYLGIALAAVLYVAVFGIAAVGYRILYVRS
jgi:hypothetical protein